MVHRCQTFEKSVGLFQISRNSPRICGCVCLCLGCSHRGKLLRPHPPGLGTDPSFPQEQEGFSWDPQGRCFPSPATSGEHLASPSQDGQMLFWRKHITHSIIFSLSLPFSFQSPKPVTHWAPCPKPELQSLPSPCPGFCPVWFFHSTAQHDEELGRVTLINASAQPRPGPLSAS